MRLLLRQDLRDRGIPYSPWQLRRLEDRGDFPRRVELVPGGKIKAWHEHEIDRWIELRKPRPQTAQPMPPAAAVRRCAFPGCDAVFEARSTGGRPPKYCPEHTTSKAKRRYLTPEQRAEILQSNASDAELAKRFGLTRQGVNQARRRAAARAGP